MWLNADEQCIIQYLKCCGEGGASAREVGRKASSKDRWKDDERWAYGPLSALKDKGLIETDPGGKFRLPPAKNAKSLGQRN